MARSGLAVLKGNIIARLWIGNLATDATADEIKALLVKYGFPAFDAMENVPGDGTQPAVILTFNNMDEETLRHLLHRIQNLFWKDHRLNVHVMMADW
jgi:hypothetical protein